MTSKRHAQVEKYIEDTVEKHKCKTLNYEEEFVSMMTLISSLNQELLHAETASHVRLGMVNDLMKAYRP